LRPNSADERRPPSETAARRVRRSEGVGRHDEKLVRLRAADREKWEGM
jgi:hypothetical protein